MKPELQRYSRQILFDGIGEGGQEKLLASRVVVMGCGALGTVTASSLARAGVGHLVIVDRDFIETNNLQRQILFSEEDIAAGLPKAEAARRKLQKVNSSIRVEAEVTDINYTNVSRLIDGADLVMDATDNFETRFLINDACIRDQVPWIYGACIGSTGMSMTILPGASPCLRCIFETAPPADMSPSCDTAGVLNTVVNVIASLQVTEAFKFLTGQRGQLRRSMVYIDVWDSTFKLLHESQQPHPACPTCGAGQFEFLEARAGSQSTSLCGRNAVQVTQMNAHPVDLAQLEFKLRGLGPVQRNKFMLKFECDGYRFTVFPDSRAIIQGTAQPTVARTLYAKYIGA